MALLKRSLGTPSDQQIKYLNCTVVDNFKHFDPNTVFYKIKQIIKYFKIDLLNK